MRYGVVSNFYLHADHGDMRSWTGMRDTQSHKMKSQSENDDVYMEPLGQNFTRIANS